MEAYEKEKIELYKPYLRAKMEKEMKLIEDGRKTKEQVTQECLQEML